MVVTIVSIVCFIIGLYWGYRAGLVHTDNSSTLNRCEELKTLASSDEDGVTKSVVRCELNLFHTGPHCHTVPFRFSNSGEKIWWKNDKNNLDQ